MKIIALEHEQPGAEAAAFERLGQAEARRAWELYQQGVIRELYFRTDKTEAVLILECDSVDEAGAHLGTLPFVAAGLIRFELIPLRAYPGFARLFAKDE